MSYLTLSQRLEEQLAKASPGDPVPSENQLARSHKVHRLTARAALQELERRHLVRRVQGRGTFVSRRLDYRISTEGPPSFTEIVRSAGGNPSTTTDLVQVRAPTPAERRSLALAPRAQVVELRRTQWLDYEPVGVGTSVLPAALVPGLEEKLGPDGSLYRALVEEYDLQPSRAWYRCEVAAAPEEVALRLNLRGRPDLFRSCGRLESERLHIPIEIQDGWLRTDRFNVVVEVGEFK
ncbi:MAG TPA: GntR family transcriptional regulator [Streptosporangiaceae bacterium]|nr:GntR family transcriptional regulator [Streptosporangiaceae bacterium]